MNQNYVCLLLFGNKIKLSHLFYLIVVPLSPFCEFGHLILKSKIFGPTIIFLNQKVTNVICFK